MTAPQITSNGKLPLATEAACPKSAERFDKQKHHLALLRIPKSAEGPSSSRTIRRPSFDGSAFNRGAPYSDEWNQYLREKVHKNCRCFSHHDEKLQGVKATARSKSSEVCNEVRSIGKNVWELFVQNHIKQAYQSAMIYRFSKQRDSAAASSPGASLLDETIETHKANLRILIAEFEKLERESRVKAAKLLEASFQVDENDPFRSYWPFVSIADSTKNSKEEIAKEKDQLLKNKIQSHALLLQRLMRDKALPIYHDERAETKRYSVHLDQAVCAFIEAHRKEIVECIGALEKGELEKRTSNKAKRLALCERLGIDPKLEKKYSRDMMTIVYREETLRGGHGTPHKHQTHTNASLKQSLLAAIERDKNPSKDYCLWRMHMTSEAARDLISEEVHAQVWKEFFKPMEKWKKNTAEKARSNCTVAEQSSGTVEGFNQWKMEKAASLRRRKRESRYRVSLM